MKKQDSTLVKILKILSDGKYHDGNTIGSLLGITRSAVWKTIKKLEFYDVEIISVKAKGYKLRYPIKPLDKEYILSHLESDQISLDVFETIGSTNEYLKDLKSEKYLKFCMSERQTLGRGRLGRKWHSPFGQNIYLSCRYILQQDISSLAGLSLIVALAVSKTLKGFFSTEKVKVKWPNDIVYDGKKIAGILVSIQAEANGSSSAIIGVGINVNMIIDKDHQISQAWTSMRKVKEEFFDRNFISVLLIENLLKYLDRFASIGFLEFIQEWKDLDCLFGKKISLKIPGGKVSGVVVGIDQMGQLQLALEDGNTKSFSSGDVSIFSSFIPAKAGI